MARMRQRGLLADDDPADHEALLPCHLGQIAEQMRFAGAEASGHPDAGGRRPPGIGPRSRQRRLEGVLYVRLLGSHLANGGPVGHAGPKRLDRGAGVHHGASHTSGAMGFCRSPGRTSGHTRICNAAY